MLSPVPLGCILWFEQFNSVVVDLILAVTLLWVNQSCPSPLAECRLDCLENLKTSFCLFLHHNSPGSVWFQYNHHEYAEPFPSEPLCSMCPLACCSSNITRSMKIPWLKLVSIALNLGRHGVT